MVRMIEITLFVMTFKFKHQQPLLIPTQKYQYIVSGQLSSYGELVETSVHKSNSTIINKDSLAK